jgi:hypothetical protein
MSMKTSQHANNLEKNKNDDIEKQRNPHFSESDINITDMFESFNLLNKNLEYSDFVTRLIGLVLIIKDFDIYDRDQQYKLLINLPVPFARQYYVEKSDVRSYTQSKFPSWLSKELRGESKTIFVLLF